MAEGPQHHVETDPDFEPLSRPRSCTWPLPRPDIIDPSGSNASSPAPQQEAGGNSEFISNFVLLEEDYGEYSGQKAPCNMFQCREGNCVHQHHRHQPQQHTAPQLPLHQQVPPLGGSTQRKISSSRRNAWGNMSYADLITKAIESSPEKRLTLSQIYDWMVKSVPYFKDKGDSNSSAGWKNSIRHNLSLHSRFVRIQNEGTGKSSWWILNPEGGKNGKSPRRRAASMDNNSKFVKSRGRAAKKKMSVQEEFEGGAGSPGSQYSNWLGSPNSHSNEDLEPWSSFRTRTSSDASTLSGRRSPFLSEQEDQGESESHMIYHGTSGSTITPTLHSLSEMAVSMEQHSSESVTENLLDNLNLLSPKAPQLGSDSPCPSNAVIAQRNSYNSTSLTPEYRKSMYNHVRMNSSSPAPMQTHLETKSGFGPYNNQYMFSAGLLKELLTVDADTRRIMSSSDTQVPEVGRGGCLMPTYPSQIQLGGHCGVKMINPHQNHTALQVNTHAIHSQSVAASRDLNTCNMIPLTSLTSLSGAPSRMTRLRTSMQLSHGHPTHTNDFSIGYVNSYRELNSAHTHGQERLPSDLENVSIEKFECNLETVLHDTLMDGGALDFNFDPPAGPHGCSQRVKTTTHNWVPG